MLEKINDLKKIIAGGRYQVENQVPVILVEHLVGAVEALRLLVDWAIEMDAYEWIYCEKLEKYFSEEEFTALQNIYGGLKYEDYLVVLAQLYLKRREEHATNDN